jgi:hypothetical protein
LKARSCIRRPLLQLVKPTWRISTAGVARRVCRRHACWSDRARPALRWPWPESVSGRHIVRAGRMMCQPPFYRCLDSGVPGASVSLVQEGEACSYLPSSIACNPTRRIGSGYLLSCRDVVSQWGYRSILWSDRRGPLSTARSRERLGHCHRSETNPGVPAGRRQRRPEAIDRSTVIERKRMHESGRARSNRATPDVYDESGLWTKHACPGDENVGS